MPNQRGENQKLLPFAVKEQFLEQLDAALLSLNEPNRSHFIRVAISEKLSKMGITIAPDLISAPARTGKGGPQRTITSYRADERRYRIRSADKKKAKKVVGNLLKSQKLKPADPGH